MLKRGLLLLFLLILSGSLVLGLTSLKLDKTNLKPGDILKISITNGENGYLNKLYFYSDSLVDIAELDCGREICYGTKTLDFEIPLDWDGKYSVVVYDYGLHDYSKKEFSVNREGKEDDKNRKYTTSYKEETNSIKINVYTPELYKEDIQIDNQLYYKLDIPGSMFYTEKKGSPRVPFIVEKIQIPDNAVNIKIKTKPIGEPKQYDNFLLCPSPDMICSPVDKVEGNNTFYEYKYDFNVDEAAYKQDSSMPSSLAEINQDGYFRSMRMLELYIYPVQYNPKQKLLKFYNSVEVTVSYDMPSSLKAKSNKKNALKGYEKVAENLVLNYKNEDVETGLDVETQTGNVVYLTNQNLRDINNQIDYLIITHSDFYNSEPLAQFADYRSSYTNLRVGIAKVEDIYQEFPNGKNDLSVKEFITYAYYNWQIPLDYILLIGDIEWVPTHQFAPNNTHEDDHWLGAVVGGDRWSDIAIGRFSVRNVQELDNIWQKTYTYEQSNIVNGDYHERVAFVHAFDDRPVDTRYRDIFKRTGFNLTELDGCGGNTIDDLLNLFNTGQNFIYYSGHGDNLGWGYPCGPNTFSYYYINDMEHNISNKDKYPIIFTSGCGTASLDVEYVRGIQSFGEELVKVKDKGAVAYYGATPDCTGSSPSLPALEWILDRYGYELGKAILVAELTWLEEDVDDYVLLGDPALQSFGYKLNQQKPDLTLSKNDVFYDITNERLTTKISNIGSQNANNVHVKVFVYENETKYDFADLYIDFIAAKSSVEASENVNFSLPPNEYLFIAEVDPENSIDESFELNNRNGMVINTTSSITVVTLIDNYNDVFLVGKSSGLRVASISNGRYNYLGYWGFDRGGKAYINIPEGLEVCFALEYYNLIKHKSYLEMKTEHFITPANVEIIIPEPTIVTLGHYFNKTSWWEEDFEVFAWNTKYDCLGYVYTGRESGIVDGEGKAYLYTLEGNEFYLELVHKNLTDSIYSYSYNDTSTLFTAPTNILLSYPTVKILENNIALTGIKLNVYDVNRGYLSYYHNLTTNDNGNVSFYLPIASYQNREVYFNFEYNNLNITTDSVDVPFDYFEINLDNQHAPELNVPYNSVNLRHGENLTLDISATDLDSDYLYFSAKNLPTGARLGDNNDRTATLIWNPNINQTGVYDVTLKVTDGFLNDTQILRISFSDVPSLATHTFPRGWNLISLPLQPDNPNPSSVFDVNVINFNLHRYDIDAMGYISYSIIAPSRFGNISVEQGYWLYCWDSAGCTASYSGSDAPDLIPLDLAGWHLIGVPSVDDVYVNDIQVEHNGQIRSIAEAATGADKWIELPFKLYVQETNGYLNIGPAGMGTIWDDNYLYPWYGYWIKTLVNDVTLKF